MGLVAALARTVWWRWLAFGWVGRLASLALALYGVGWLLGNAGMDGPARSLGEAGIFVFSILLAALFIRLIWRDSTAHHRR